MRTIAQPQVYANRDRLPASFAASLRPSCTAVSVGLAWPEVGRTAVETTYKFFKAEGSAVAIDHRRAGIDTHADGADLVETVLRLGLHRGRALTLRVTMLEPCQIVPGKPVAKRHMRPEHRLHIALREPQVDPKPRQTSAVDLMVER